MFRDRREAAERLAAAIRAAAPHLHDPLVLAVPPGGLVIGAVLARALRAELDVLDALPRQRELFRAARPAAAVAGRSVILTDDGVGSGATMTAALRQLRDRGAGELVIAVPVGTRHRLRELEAECDTLVCLVRPRVARDTGRFYAYFEKVDDDRAVALLRAFAPISASPQPQGAHR